MNGVSLLIFIGLYTGWSSAQFLNNRPFPTYSLENMPDTDFSCRDKILGGYYADAETQCQMFHVCVKVAGVGIQDFRFLCPNGTAFDQDHQICAEWEDVDCDATTLYYSSDNFDLYRIGSGFESKAVKYGEDEETFALQRAETGDVRLNREHQTQRVNQQKDVATKRRPVQQQQQNERDIFKTSSSSNFYNNRNNGKEEDDDSDDNSNFNQDRDPVQKRKLIRKQQQQQQRRPVDNQNYDNNYNQQKNNRRPVENQSYNNNNNQQQQQQQNNRRPQSLNQENRRPQNRNNQDYQEKNNYETQTYRPQRPNGFSNNFAGSSYIPTTSSTTTTSRPSSTTTISDDQYTTALNNHRLRNGQRSQYNDDSYRTNSPSSTTYKISTPAPFRQTQQYSRPTVTTTTTTTIQPPQKETENYPLNFPFASAARHSQNVKSTTTENYPSTRNNENTKIKQTENYPTTPFQVKKPSSFAKTENYPTTQPPKPRPSTTQFNNYPSTFSPKTNSAYSQISHQTTQYKSNNQPSPFSTPRTTPFTQYTPTVPKITSTTTPVPPPQSPPQQPPRSNRYDETQYDDGSYDATKYERNDDEFLKTAHSQNIASSRNEYVKTTTRNQQQQSTQKPQYESPRPFSVTPNTPSSTTPNKNQQSSNIDKNINNNKNNDNIKKVKDASYDYAYYDTNVGSEPEYDIDTDIKKSTVKN